VALPFAIYNLQSTHSRSNAWRWHWRWLNAVGAKKHVIFSSSGGSDVSPFVIDALSRVQPPQVAADDQSLDRVLSRVEVKIRTAIRDLVKKGRSQQGRLTIQTSTPVSTISWAKINMLLQCPLAFCFNYLYRRDPTTSVQSVCCLVIRLLSSKQLTHLCLLLSLLDLRNCYAQGCAGLCRCCKGQHVHNRNTTATI
jgi:hypothetical protein